MLKSMKAKCQSTVVEFAWDFPARSRQVVGARYLYAFKPERERRDMLARGHSGQCQYGQMGFEEVDGISNYRLGLSSFNSCCERLAKEEAPLHPHYDSRGGNSSWITGNSYLTD
jgi:hypothetical protein